MDLLRFGLFEFNAATGELKRSGTPIKLQLQPAKVLALLATHPGQLFTRDEIQSRVWGPDTQVDFEQGLNYCIKEIRAALGDRADNPAYVETLARRGYRFIAPVERGATPEPDVTVDSEPTRGRVVPEWRLRRRPLVLISVLLAVLACALLFPRLIQPKRVVVAVLPFENLTGNPEHEVFTQGLTEETQLQLARLQPSQLTVIARTTMRGYARRPHPIAALVDELGVDYVLEGTVRYHPKDARVRITARLVRGSDRRELWSDRLQEPLEDMVDTQRRIARVLADNAGVALAQREPSRLMIEAKTMAVQTP